MSGPPFWLARERSYQLSMAVFENMAFALKLRHTHAFHALSGERL
jgi:hypothetical protein